MNEQEKIAQRLVETRRRLLVTKLLSAPSAPSGLTYDNGIIRYNSREEHSLAQLPLHALLLNKEQNTLAIYWREEDAAALKLVDTIGPVWLVLSMASAEPPFLFSEKAWKFPALKEYAVCTDDIFVQGVWAGPRYFFSENATLNDRNSGEEIFCS